MIYLKYKYTKYITSIFSKMLILLTIYGCVEPYEGGDFNGNFEDVLVINATVTNETKRQEVTLTRSFSFEDEVAPTEENAQVTIYDGTGIEFTFEEVEPGKYLSTQEFAAEINKDYSLKIITESGKTYISSTMQLPVESTSIDNLYAERITNDDGIEGMGVFVDSFDPSRGSNYYRYEYEETFKIIAPFWSPFDVVVTLEGIQTPGISVILREQEERVCYGTDVSKTINVSSTLGLTEDRLKRFSVRFINRDDYILSYRYSILVKQYVQNPESFSYYETLNGLSQSSGNVFSEDQPGFLAGNIFSLDIHTALFHDPLA